MPLVSVIIPNYNHEAFLAQRLDSILQQSFQDFEVIVLDDASTDDSRAVIEKYREEIPAMQVFWNEKNTGSPFAQWNKGARIARGKYLWFAESDDFCEPELLAELVPLLEENEKVGIAYAQSILVDEQGEKLHSYIRHLEFIYKSQAWQQNFIKSGASVCREWLLFHNPIPNASGALLRRSVYESAGKADPEMLLNGDWFLYAKMLAQSDLAFSARELNYFRVHPATQRERSRTTPKVYFEIIRIHEYIRNNIAHSDENADRAIRKVSTWWQGNLYFQKWNKANLSLNRSLYRYFRKYRRHIPYHIVYTLVVEMLRQLLRFTGLLRPAKSLRKKLFPGKYFDL